MVPVFNEAHRIGRLLKVAKKDKVLDFLFVDDGSTDGTAELIEEAGLKVLCLVHTGKGGAVQAGLFRACSSIRSGSWHHQWIGVMDADMSVPLWRFKQLRECADATVLYYGERTFQQRKFSRWLFSQAFRLVRGLMFGVWVKDTQCPMKFAHVQVMDTIRRQMKLNKFAYDVEYFIHAPFTKAVTVDYEDVGGGSVKVLKHGWEMFKELWWLRTWNITLYNFVRWKYVRFVCVGAVGTTMSGAILFTLTEWFGLWYMASFVFGAFVGSINNYLMNKHWVFK